MAGFKGGKRNTKNELSVQLLNDPDKLNLYSKKSAYATYFEQWMIPNANSYVVRPGHDLQLRHLSN